MRRHDLDPLLSATDVHLAFGGKKALDGVSLQVYPGETVGLIGPNGSGKTTLVNVLSRHLDPDAGQLIFQNTDLSRVRPHQLAALGVVRTFQGFHLFGDASVLDNVLIGGHHTLRAGAFASLLRPPWVTREERDLRARAEMWLERLDLTRLAHFPASDLSTGQRRLVELARAAMASPKLLLLDEPAAGLNPRMTEALIRILKQFAEDRISMVLIEHKVQMISALSDYVLVLDSGRELASGSAESIRSNEEVIRAYLGVKR